MHLVPVSLLILEWILPTWSSIHRVTFSVKSSTSSLRIHLDKLHHEAYMEWCNTNSFEPKIKSFCKRPPLQTTLDSYGTRGDTVTSKQFLQLAFVRALMKWVIANNQVCSLRATVQLLFMQFLVTSRCWTSLLYANVLHSPKWCRDSPSY